MAKKNPHRGLFTFQCFVFFLIFAFLCLIFSSFPLLLDFSKPKSGPSNEVIGIIIIFAMAQVLEYLIFGPLGKDENGS